MQIILHKSFKKMYEQLLPSVKQKFKERRNLFLVDPFNPILKNHSVSAAYLGWRSINITGDYRALYESQDNDLVVFVNHCALKRTALRKQIENLKSSLF